MKHQIKSTKIPAKNCLNNQLILNKQKSYKFGIMAEKIVILWLKICCYNIVATRYSNYYGEIDIIATKKKKIFFIEVKARKNFDYNFDFISQKQIKRIKKSAQYFLGKNLEYYNFEYFFDLFVVNKFFIFTKYSNFC